MIFPNGPTEGRSSAYVCEINQCVSCLMLPILSLVLLCQRYDRRPRGESLDQTMLVLISISKILLGAQKKLPPRTHVVKHH